MYKFASLAMILAVGLFAAPHNLELKHKAGDEVSYKVSLSGMGEMSGELKIKTTSIDEKGNAKLNFSGSGDGDGGGGSVNENVNVNKFGHPSEFPIQGGGILISAFNIVNARPEGELKEGQEFKIEVRNDAVDMSLTGKVASIKEVDGKTLIDVTEEGTVDPKMGAATVKLQSTFEAETGQLVKSKASVDIPSGGGTMTFSINRKEISK